MWAGLGVAAVAVATILLVGDHARSWHYFTDAGSGLLDLDLYRAHPELQFGPAMAAIARVLMVVPAGLEAWTVMAVSSLLGVLTWWAITRATGWPDPPGRELRLVVVGVAMLVPWVRLAAYTAHPDDIIVLTATAMAVLMLVRGRWGWATVLMILAVAVKPWAVVVAPMLLADRVPHPWRRIAAVVCVAALSWLPYLISPGTLEALASFAVDVSPNSGLRALGFVDATTPAWLRPAQLGIGIVAATVAARRSGPLMVPLAGVAVRLALDPATHHYYTVGFIVAALLAELSLPGVRWPWRTAVGVAVLEGATLGVTLGGAMPALRFATLVIAVLIACRMPGVASRRPDPQPTRVPSVPQQP